MKGQGALEYLMTYGWALLIIVVVGAALFALGIFSPQTKSVCTGFQYYTYSNQKMTTTQYTLEVLNGNQDVTVTNLSVEGTDLGTVTLSPTGTLGSGKRVTISGANDPTTKSSGDSYSYSVSVTYNTPTISGLKDMATCTGKVQ